MANLKDVAKLAGVDVSTASRALNAGKSVSPETRAKVAAAAAKLGYKPNVMAQALRAGRTHTLGVLLPRLHLSSFSEILLGIEQKARTLNYFVAVCMTNDDPALEKEHIVRLSSHVDGIIIVGTGKNNKLLRKIRADGTAVIQLIRCQDPEISSIVAEYEAGACEAVRYLYGKGCRRIALINGPERFVPFQLRRDGYVRAMEELRLEPITIDGEGETTFDYGYACAERLLDRYPALDAVLAAVDIQGAGAIRALAARNIRIPEEVRVMSLTGYELGRVLETGMTAMAIPTREIGAEAVRMIVQEIEAPEDKKPSLQHLSFAVTLVEREST